MFSRVWKPDETLALVFEIVLIPCPALLLNYFFTIPLRANFRKHVILVSSTPQIRIFQDGGVLIK